MQKDDVARIAAEITPLQAAALVECCKRGSTRTNDGGLVDTLLSGMCSKIDENITNGWLITWSMAERESAYINCYTPTPLGLAVRNHLTENRDAQG